MYLYNKNCFADCIHSTKEVVAETNTYCFNKCGHEYKYWDYYYASQDTNRERKLYICCKPKDGKGLVIFGNFM